MIDQTVLRQQHNIYNILRDVATKHYTPMEGLELIAAELKIALVIEDDGTGFWKPKGNKQ